MIDINELRHAVEAAGLNAISVQEVLELLDRLEAAEAEALEEARLNGMGSEQEAALMAKLEAAERERDECNRRRLEAAGHFAAQTALMKKKYDDLRAELDALKSREGEVVYRWLALDYSGFCYGSNPPDNLPNRCNLKAFYAPAEVAP